MDGFALDGTGEFRLEDPIAYIMLHGITVPEGTGEQPSICAEMAADFELLATARDKPYPPGDIGYIPPEYF